MLGGLLKTALKIGVLTAATGAVLGVIGHHENNKKKVTDDTDASLNPMSNTEDLKNEAVIDADAAEAEDGRKVQEAVMQMNESDDDQTAGDSNEAA